MIEKRSTRVVLLVILLAVFTALGFFMGNTYAAKQAAEVNDTWYDHMAYAHQVGRAFEQQDFGRLFDLFYSPAKENLPDEVRQRLAVFEGVTMTLLGSTTSDRSATSFQLLFQVDGTPPPAFQKQFPCWYLLQEKNAQLGLWVEIVEEDDGSLGFNMSSGEILTPRVGL